MQPLEVLIRASDPIRRAGLTAILRSSASIRVVGEEPGDKDAPTVLVLAEHLVGARQLNEVRMLRQQAGPGLRCVVVTDRLNQADMLQAVRCGVVSVLPTRDASAARLVSVVAGAAQGHSSLPRGLQSALLGQLARLRTDVLEPSGFTLSGLDLRELDVIRLVAEGFRTDEIAAKLSRSEGSVKSALLTAAQRIGLSNRTHVVSYAIRAGAMA